jgi:hypothetical protein
MKPVLFVPSNDTMARWMPLVANVLHAPIAWGIIPDRHEGAPELLSSLGHKNFAIGRGFDYGRYSAVVLGIDWGYEERLMIKEMRGHHVPSICIQEGAICAPYGEMYDLCDYFIVASELWRRETNRPRAILGGLPIADLEQPRLPIKPARVMINCNFAYDVEQGLRNDYLAKAINACDALKLDWFISGHPRDKFDGGPWKDRFVRSNIDVSHSDFSTTAVMISRTSTQIYMAMAAGIEVIYLPAGRICIFDTAKHSALWYTDTLGLDLCLERAMDARYNRTEARENLRDMFLSEHLGPNHGHAGTTCAAIIEGIVK